jgi:hypothetical protein
MQINNLQVVYQARLCSLKLFWVHVGLIRSLVRFAQWFQFRLRGKSKLLESLLSPDMVRSGPRVAIAPVMFDPNLF